MPGVHGKVVGSAMVALCVGFLPLPSRAQSSGGAGGAAWSRHPRRASSVVRPAAVPEDFVLTPNGFFHPSCVWTLRADEVMGRDGVIRGPDGVENERVPACSYPRFDLRGHTSAQGRAPAGGGGGGVQYDGWILSYVYTGSFATGSILSTSWIVPQAPVNAANQVLFTFNGFGSSLEIAQPVVGFNDPVNGGWGAQSIDCCLDGNEAQGSVLTISPGDVIKGVVTPSSCDATTGACQNWTIVTTDVTTGQTSTLNYQAFQGGVPNQIYPAVLETYGVSSCDMLPANGEIAFYGNTLTDPSGAPETEAYALDMQMPPPQSPPGTTVPPISSELPTQCGYAGVASGDHFTLIFGMNPTSSSSGSGSGSGSGSSSGSGSGSGSGSTSGSDGGGASGSGSGGAGTSSSGSGGGGSSGGTSSGSGGSGSSGGSASSTSSGSVGGSGGAGSSGGANGTSSGTPHIDAGSAAEGGSGMDWADSPSPSACACGVAGASSSGACWNAALVGLLVGVCRRFRPRRR